MGLVEFEQFLKGKELEGFEVELIVRGCRYIEYTLYRNEERINSDMVGVQKGDGDWRSSVDRLATKYKAEILRSFFS